MGTTIPQRDLRNHNSRIIDRVSAGESFTVTRDGVPVADVVPHTPTRKPPRFRPARDAGARQRLSKAEADAWMAEIRAIDQFVHDDATDPWERTANRG